MTIIDQIEALNASVRDLNQQLGEAQQKLAAYESRKVPLSESDAARIFHAHPVESDGPSALAVARAAMVAAESPAAVKAAFEAWRNHAGDDAVLVAIRAAHDAAIEGGCGAARDRFNAEVEHHKLTMKDRDKWLAEARRLEKERDDLRHQLDALTRPIDGVRELAVYGWRAAYGDRDCSFSTIEVEVAKAIASRVIGALRVAFIEACGHGAELYAQFFDAAVASLKIEPAKVEAPPVDDERLDATDGAHPAWWRGSDHAAKAMTAQLSAAMGGEIVDDWNAMLDAVRKMYAASNAPKAPVDTRPVVKVGQVWTFPLAGGSTYEVDGFISRDGATYAASKGKTFMRLCYDGRPDSPSWTVVTPSPKREPFEWPNKGYMFGVNDGVALRDRIREIERRLEAGGL